MESVRADPEFIARSATSSASIWMLPSGPWPWRTMRTLSSMHRPTQPRLPSCRLPGADDYHGVRHGSISLFDAYDVSCTSPIACSANPVRVTI